MSGTAVIGLGSVVAAIAVAGVLQFHSARRVVGVGFWFEDVTFELPRLRADGYGDALNVSEQRRITAAARQEIATAFAGLRVAVTDDRSALYTVRVIQQFPPSPRTAFGVAGQSRGIAGLGGTGAVSFGMLGSLAIAHAPPGASRAIIIDGIGRGIGRSAVHELAHQMLSTTPIDGDPDPASYEFGKADRPAQFYGEIRWNSAGATLFKRYGRASERDPRRTAATSVPEPVR
jgi:hypothetical protein